MVAWSHKIKEIAGVWAASCLLPFLILVFFPASAVGASSIPSPCGEVWRRCYRAQGALAVAHSKAATLGWGRVFTPLGAPRKARLATLPIKGRDELRAAAQHEISRWA
jgi:hypothetical protein